MVEQSKNFARNAGDYAQHSSPQYAWAKELIPKIKLTGKEALLDIGCGDSKVAAILVKCLPNGSVVGVDSPEDMINLALKPFCKMLTPDLSFQRMEVRSLTFEAKFDLVFANTAFHWIIDQKVVLQGVQRSLKSGGRLLFLICEKGNAQEIISILDVCFRKNL